MRLTINDKKIVSTRFRENFTLELTDSDGFTHEIIYPGEIRINLKINNVQVMFIRIYKDNTMKITDVNMYVHLICDNVDLLASKKAITCNYYVEDKNYSWQDTKTQWHLVRRDLNNKDMLARKRAYDFNYNIETKEIDCQDINGYWSKVYV